MSPESPTRHLEALHGLYAPLEEELARRLEGHFPQLRLAERWKLPLLEEDLEAWLREAQGEAGRLPRSMKKMTTPVTDT